MESTKWIANAATLTRRIKDQALVSSTLGGGDREEGNAIQKEVNNAFQGLQNPTLPSAYKLCDIALEHGFYVDPKVQHRLNQGESCWPN
jgi:hypothetical protein